MVFTWLPLITTSLDALTLIFPDPVSVMSFPLMMIVPSFFIVIEAVKVSRSNRSNVLLNATVELPGESLPVVLRNLSQEGALVQGNAGEDVLPENAP